MSSAPRKGSSPMKLVLIGCGCILGLVLAALGSCAALTWWGVGKLKEYHASVAAAGEPYLRENGKAAGEVRSITPRTWMEGRIHRVNDGGSARIAYDIVTDKGSGTADVWLEYRDGKWVPVGLEIVIGSETIDVGRKIEIPESSSSWDD